MTLYLTSNENIILKNNEYQRIKCLIQNVEKLREYLLNNKIIKVSKSYTVLYNDNFSYSNYQKYKKHLIAEYFGDSQNLFLEFCKKYSIEYVLYTSIEDIIPTFNFTALKELKRNLKAKLKFLLWVDNDDENE